MKLTKILLGVIAVMLVVLLALAWFMPSNTMDAEDKELLSHAGDIGEESKQVWLEDYKIAMSYFEKGDYDTAIEVFDNVIAIDPNNYTAYLQRGKAYEATGAYIDADWDYQAAKFLADGNTIYDFEYVPTYEEPTVETQTQPVETEPRMEYRTSEESGWKEDAKILSTVTRYDDENVLIIYTFHYDDEGRIVGYTEEDYWDGDGKLSFEDTWEYTYNEEGKILKEYNPTHSSQTTYDYNYVDGVLTRCLLSLEGVGYRTYSIGTSADGYVTSVEGKGVYDSNYGFERQITYDKNGIPIRSKGSETLSHGTSTKSYSYEYYPALMQITDHTGSLSFRIDDFQLASLPDFFVPDKGSFETDEDGYVARILDKDDALLWELTYETKGTVNQHEGQKQRNRRIARINEYNSKGVTETNTFDYDQNGLLSGYTTTYYENGNIIEKDVWTFDYTDDGLLFDERRDWGEEDYIGYTHLLENGIDTGYQIFYGRGIQQQFSFEYDSDSNISRITGIGIHDYIYESDLIYSYDDNTGTATCTGMLTSTENSEYEISKEYDYSYPGAVLVEDNTTLNGTALPVSRYLRVDMPQYISLPQVVYYASDEIITDDYGYIVKILDKSGALRCELIFDWC